MSILYLSQFVFLFFSLCLFLIVNLRLENCSEFRISYFLKLLFKNYLSTIVYSIQSTTWVKKEAEIVSSKDTKKGDFFGY